MKQFEKIGETLIKGTKEASSPPLPLQHWKDFDLRFTVEYPAIHYAAELGFWASVMGLGTRPAICRFCASNGLPMGWTRSSTPWRSETRFSRSSIIVSTSGSSAWKAPAGCRWRYGQAGKGTKRRKADFTASSCIT